MDICGKRVRWQLCSTLALCIMSTTHGISLGWFSPSLPILQSDESPIGESVNINDVMWIGSMLAVGSLICNMIIWFPIGFVGIKKCMYFVALPNVMNWILIYIARNSIYLYVARILLGISGGTLVVSFPIFIAEISDNSFGALLRHFFMLTLCGGITVGFVLVFYTTYHVLPCIVIVLPILYVILIIPLPEPPHDLLRRGRDEKAEKSYYFYKNLTKDPTKQNENKAEFNSFRERVLSGGVKEKITFQDFFNKVSMKAFGLIAVLLICNQMSGTFAIFNYASTIFTELGSTMEPNICAIVLGVVQLFGLASAVLLVDRVGRRWLLMPSLALMGLGELSVGLLKSFASPHFLDHHGWLGLVLMCFVAYTSSAGLIALTFVLIVELLPVKIRAPGASISMCGLSCSVFVALMTYPVVINEYGVDVTMYMSAGFCFLGFILMGTFLPETKGRSMTH
uniref:Facilitated trehalose transporter Tret1 isoform X1 n=3 Tax=Drosophila rhopaloa TaxID=1041015 RepID=A0A6P4F7N7_DRORH